MDRESALADFTAWFVANYPGPDTIISDPLWHAPRVFRAAERALHVRPPVHSALPPMSVERRMRLFTFFQEVIR